MIQTEKFSPKAAWTASILSALLFAAGVFLLIFSPSLSGGLQGFLEQRVFHRTFDADRWLPTITSLLSYPLFVGILLASILYPKLAQRNKIFLLCVYAAGLLVMLAVCFVCNTDGYMDSDMGAEIALAKECFLSKSFWPRSWCYSTELRTLNTQLISAPLFAFTDSWHLVKVLTCMFCLPILFVCAWNLLDTLGVRSFTLRLLSAIICVCPYSLDVWQFVTLGNYYVPKIAIFYVHLSLYLALAFADGRVGGKRTRLKLVALYALSFIEGLTSIRYIFVLVLPVTAVAVCHKASCFKASPTDFWKDAKSRLSLVSLGLASLGYLINALLLHSFYNFSIWHETAFGKIGEVSFQTVHDDMLRLLGYNEQVSVLSPAGITNFLLYIFVFLLLFFIIRFLFKDRNSYDERQSFYIIFTLASLVLTGFLYLHVKYIARYFILELSFFPMIVAIIIEGKGKRKESPPDDAFALPRYLLALAGGLFVLTGSFTTLSATFGRDVNEDKAAVISFLEQSGMKFGYTITPYANRLAFLVDGRIDFAMVAADEGDVSFTLEDEFRPNLFLSSMRYYDEDFHKGEECFFLVDRDSWELSKENTVFKAGKVIYNDGGYMVFSYPSPDNFKRSFGR